MVEQPPEEEHLVESTQKVREEEMAEQEPQGPVPGDLRSQVHDALRCSRDRVRGLQWTMGELSIQVATQDVRLGMHDKEVRGLREQLAAGRAEVTQQAARVAYYYAAYISIVLLAVE